MSHRISNDALGYDGNALQRWVQGLTLARLIVDPRPRQMDGFCISTRHSDHAELGVVCALLGVTEVGHGWNPIAEIGGSGRWALPIYSNELLNIFIPGVQRGDNDNASPAPAVDEAAFETARAIERILYRARRFCLEPAAADGEELISPTTRPDLWAEGEMIVHRVIVSGMASIAKSFSICRSPTGFWLTKTGGAVDETTAKWVGTGMGEQRIYGAGINLRRSLLDDPLGTVEQRLSTEAAFHVGDHIAWVDVSEVKEKIVTDAADQQYSLIRVKAGKRKSTNLRFIGHDISIARAFFQPVADRFSGSR